MSIYTSNGFRAMASLRRAAADPRVQEIEGEGMEEGRVFIHLERGYCFDRDYGDRDTNAHSKSVGSAAELRDALKSIVEEKP